MHVLAYVYIYTHNRDTYMIVGLDIITMRGGFELIKVSPIKCEWVRTELDI